MSLPANPSISVVVPVYGCISCLEVLCTQLDMALGALTDRYEIILVDDRSPDNWWSIAAELQEAHPALTCIRLSRNYGQHIAITAGACGSQG